MAEKLFSYADKQVIEEVGSGGGGSGGDGSTGPLLVHENESHVLDATWQELCNAASAGRQVVVFARDYDDPNYGLFDQVLILSSLLRLAGSDVNDGYIVDAGGTEWTAATEDEYPTRL